ncbi:hypothetical protein FE236_00255 [Mariprofundus erugo]|uniref:hypothetical protein n=1 Tax=Mariprofundus erugo TaxID=2528639 RepID=UPI0010FE1420|nr:hypothetical protein [Mariprofundus erugo]TLS78225.1 hypothetical protein FE236_00255 [Mariprofundus erugo]
MQLRVFAVLSFSLIVYWFISINPFVVHAANVGVTVFISVLDLMLVGFMAGCIYLWQLAPEIPDAKLPDPQTWSGPNQIPNYLRIRNSILAFVLMVYGTYGLYINDIYVPGRRGEGIHFSGIAAWLVYAAMLNMTANLVAVIIDHYDRRNNELIYAHIATATLWLAWLFFIVASLLHCFYQ